MLSALLLNIVAFTLQPSVPPVPPLTDKQYITVLSYCREDITQYIKGDKTWLERQVTSLSPEERRLVLTACGFYATGIADGIIVATDKDN
jgi:hypothetical protein